jgi:NAD+ kinase
LQTIGIVLNVKKQEAFTLFSWLKERLRKQGITIVMLEEHAIAVGCPDLAVDDAQFKSRVDLAITLGGDGTLLGTARRLAGTEKPLLGVNLGRLGFLTDVEIKLLPEGIERLLTGHYHLEKRTMLQTVVFRQDQEISRHSALNDVVIAKGAIARLIRLETYVDDKYVSTFPADGLIISTATGSTGYSLSAGGPLVHPTLPVIVITPICPHTLGARSLIIADHQQVKVIVQANHSEMLLTVDGQQGVNLLPNDMIIVRKAPYVTNLVKVSGRDYFEVLHSKMSSSGDGRG